MVLKQVLCASSELVEIGVIVEFIKPVKCGESHLKRDEFVREGTEL